MRNFIVFNAVTNAVFTLESSSDNSPPNPSSDYKFIEIFQPFYSIEKYYIKNNIVKIKPDNLDELFIFNAVSEQWEYSPELYNRKIESEKEKFIYKRLHLLQASDWTDTLSAQTRLGDLLCQAWQDYRQALRDITLQPNYPLDVIWPIAP
jgi:hypothetical protein